MWDSNTIKDTNLVMYVSLYCVDNQYETKLVYNWPKGILPELDLLIVKVAVRNGLSTR
jgi:hypothetical protein